VFFHQSDSEMKDEGEIMSLDEMIEEIVEEFKKDPRNKVFAPEERPETTSRKKL